MGNSTPDGLYSILSVIKFGHGSVSVMPLAMDLTKDRAEQLVKLLDAIPYSEHKQATESFLTIELSAEVRKLLKGQVSAP